MKIFSSRKSDTGCVVELNNEGYLTNLSLEKSLQIVGHSPDGFQWGYNGSGPAQLAAAILNEITDDPEITRSYYQMFKFDHVAKRSEIFEISEEEVLIWLRAVGAEITLRQDFISAKGKHCKSTGGLGIDVLVNRTFRSKQ